MSKELKIIKTESKDSQDVSEYYTFDYITTLGNYFHNDDVYLSRNIELKYWENDKAFTERISESDDELAYYFAKQLIKYL